MEYPINESSILIVITGIGVAALAEMFVHFSIASIFQKSSNELSEQHFWNQSKFQHSSHRGLCH